MSNEITFYRGDSASIQCTVTNGTGGAYDVTGNTATFSVKKEEDDTAALITKTVGSGITLSGTDGILTVDIGSGETSELSGKYYYDIECAKSGNVYTVVKDRFKITKDVTT